MKFCGIYAPFYKYLVLEEDLKIVKMKCQFARKDVRGRVFIKCQALNKEDDLGEYSKTFNSRSNLDGHLRDSDGYAYFEAEGDLRNKVIRNNHRTFNSLQTAKQYFYNLSKQNQQYWLKNLQSTIDQVEKWDCMVKNLGKELGYFKKAKRSSNKNKNKRKTI